MRTQRVGLIKLIGIGKNGDVSLHHSRLVDGEEREPRMTWYMAPQCWLYSIRWAATISVAYAPPPTTLAMTVIHTCSLMLKGPGLKENCGAVNGSGLGISE